MQSRVQQYPVRAHASIISNMLMICMKTHCKRSCREKKAIVHEVCASFQIGVECCEEKAITSKIYNQPAVLKPP